MAKIGVSIAILISVPASPALLRDVPTFRISPVYWTRPSRNKVRKDIARFWRLACSTSTRTVCLHKSFQTKISRESLKASINFSVIKKRMFTISYVLSTTCRNSSTGVPTPNQRPMQTQSNGKHASGGCIAIAMPSIANALAAPKIISTKRIWDYLNSSKKQ